MEVSNDLKETLEEDVHQIVCDFLEVLDKHFGEGVFKDDFAYQLDKMIMERAEENLKA